MFEDCGFCSDLIKFYGSNFALLFDVCDSVSSLVKTPFFMLPEAPVGEAVYNFFNNEAKHLLPQQAFI